MTKFLLWDISSKGVDPTVTRFLVSFLIYKKYVFVINDTLVCNFELLLLYMFVRRAQWAHLMSLYARAGSNYNTK